MQDLQFSAILSSQITKELQGFKEAYIYTANGDTSPTTIILM